MAQSEREYLVGSVWPTNRSGILGDTELDGRLPPAIKLVHVTMAINRSSWSLSGSSSTTFRYSAIACGVLR